MAESRSPAGAYADGGIAPGTYVIALCVGLCGIAVYALLAAGVMAPEGTTLFGQFVYNYYFLSLMEGRFDIPLRVITLEGHYDTTGRAYVYHGIAPVLTRILAAPFVDLKTVSLTPFSIWFWAVLGTVLYHGTVLAALRRFCADPAARRFWTILLSVAIWFAGPGMLISSNPTLYMEAIAVGYFCSALWIAAILRVAMFGSATTIPMIIMALAAGLALHARVPMAVGLYAGTCALIGLHLLRHRLRDLKGPVVALLIMFVFGLCYLGLNAARFGDPFQVSGSNDEDAAEVQYGFAFWGVNPADGDQLDAFHKDGTFALPRMLPNLYLYLTDVPKTALSDKMLEIYRDMTSGLGRIRVETPRVGMLWMWGPWAMVALMGVVAGRRAGVAVLPALVVVVGTGIGAALILAYGTMAMRYRVDLWPLMAALALLALPRFLVAHPGRTVTGLTVAALAVGVVMSLATARSYSKQSAEVSIFSFWSEPMCLDMTTTKGFSAEEAALLCKL